MATTTKSTPPQSTKTTQNRGEATQQFAGAYADWMQQQQEVSINYQRKCSDIYFQLINSLNEIGAKSKRLVEEAQLKILIAGPSANTSEESWQSFQQLLQDYNQILADFQNDQARQDAIQKAYEAYAAATQKAHEEAQASLTRSNQGYLKVLKEAWSRINVDSLSPTERQAIQWSTSMAFQAGIM